MKTFAINGYNQRNHTRQNMRISNQNSHTRLLNEETKDTISFKGAKGAIKGAAVGSAASTVTASVGTALAFGATLFTPAGLLLVGAYALLGGLTGGVAGHALEEGDLI